MPRHLSMRNFSGTAAASSRQTIRKLFFDAALTWKSIDWVRSITQLPIILKGILTAEDAVEALKHDIQGIVVSNHGGRQLDGVPATVRVSHIFEVWSLTLLSFSPPPTHSPTCTTDRCSSRGGEGCEWEGGGVHGWRSEARDGCIESTSHGSKSSVHQQTSDMGTCL